MPINLELIKILCCPECQGSLEYKSRLGRESLYCINCDIKYPIRKGIPILMPKESQPKGILDRLADLYHRKRGK